jgi:hypothetical protein
MEQTLGTIGVAAAASARTRVHRDRVFFTALPIAMAVVVFVGFSRSYYLKTVFGTPGLSPLYHLHGLLFTSWMLLMMIQPALVAARRTPLHRRIGVGGGVLAAAMSATALAVTLDLGHRGSGPPGISPLSFLIVPFSTVVVFPVLIGGALLWRRMPDVHKRLMLIGSLELVPAGFGRWPMVADLGPLAYFGLTDLFVIAILIHDLVTRGRFDRATVLGGLFLLASQVLRISISGSSAWLSFAGWLVG